LDVFNPVDDSCEIMTRFENEQRRRFSAFSKARLHPYLSAAKGDSHFALRLYVWNARLCAALYFPLQIAELSLRNAICLPIRKRFQSEWFQNPKFINILPDRMKAELSEKVDTERKRKEARQMWMMSSHPLPSGFESRS
jgi:hypothetical protein